MKRTKGKITHWNRRKAYGFITPSKESKEVFVHISEFRDRRQMPSLNERVEYSLSTDNQGRPCATDVARLSGEKSASQSNGGSRAGWIIGAAVAAALIVAALLYFL